MTSPFGHAAQARILQSARKMTPGTFQGQSRVATPCGCQEPIKPFVPAAAGEIPAFQYLFVDAEVLGWPDAGGNYPDDWTPTSPTVIAMPVTFQLIFGGLTGCELPDGRGLLMWTQDSARASVRCAVQPSPADWLTTGFVDSGDAATVIVGAQSCSAVCYVIAGQVYATVSEPLQCRIFKANDPADPVGGGWTVHGTLDFGTGTDAPFGNNDQVASVPIITSDGTWSIVQGYSAQYHFAGPTGISRFSWAHLTSPDGVTWTRHNGDPNDNLYSEVFQSRQTVEDPDGNINFAFNREAFTDVTYYLTPATGGSLTTGITSGDTPEPSVFLRNAADQIYAIERSGYFRLRTGDGVPYSDWSDTGVPWTGGLLSPGQVNTIYKLFVLTESTAPGTGAPSPIGGGAPPPTPEPPDPEPPGVPPTPLGLVVYTPADIASWTQDSEYTALAKSPGGNLARVIQNPGTQISLAQLAACRDDSVWAKTQAVLCAIDGDPARLAKLYTYFENYHSVTSWQVNSSNQTQRLNCSWIVDNQTQAASIIGYSDPAFDAYLIDACLPQLDWPINPNWHATMAASQLGIGALTGDAGIYADAVAYYSLRLSQSIYHSTYDGGTVQPISGGSVTQHWFNQVNSSRVPIVFPFPDGTNAERVRDHGHVCLGNGGWVHGAFTILANGGTMTAEDHDRLVAGLNYHATRVDQYLTTGTTPTPSAPPGGPEYKQSWFPAKRYCDLTAETGASLAAIVTRYEVLNYPRSGANHLVAERKADG